MPQFVRNVRVAWQLCCAEYGVRVCSTLVGASAAAGALLNLLLFYSLHRLGVDIPF